MATSRLLHAQGDFFERAGEPGGGAYTPRPSTEDGAALTLFSSRSPRVRPPPSGPQEDCLSSKFKGRYAKSEVFCDHGRRHFANGWHEAKVAWAPGGTTEATSAPNGTLSPRHHSGAHSPRASSPRVGPRSGALSPRASSPGACSPTKPMNLFAAAPGTWTPMQPGLRSPSRAASPSGCGSPGRPADHRCSSELVAEAARRLSQADLAQLAWKPGQFPPRSPRSPGTQGSRSGASSVPGPLAGPRKCHTHLPPPPMTFSPEHQAALQRSAPSQMTSSNVTNLLQTPSQSSSVCPPSTKGLTLTRAGWSQRRSLQSDCHQRISEGVMNLIKGDAKADMLPMHASNERCSSPRGPALGPRQVDTSSPSKTPWALDENGTPTTGERLADVARSCLQRTELRIESEQKLGFCSSRNAVRPRMRCNVKITNGLGTSRPDAVTTDTITPAKVERCHVTPSRRVPTRSTFGGQSSAGLSAENVALIKFAAEVAVSKSYPLQESGNKVRPANMSEAGQTSWQEPVKTHARESTTFTR